MKSFFHIKGTILFLCLPLLGWSQYQFIENKGQWEDEILFRTYVDAGEVFMENDGLRFLFYDPEKIKDFHEHNYGDSLLDCHAIKLQLLGSNTPSPIEKYIEGGTDYNYFIGRNRQHWVSGARAYEKMILRDVYPGIDFEVYSYQHKIKYNFHIHPGADPSKIKIQYKGVDDIVIENGMVKAYTSLRKIIEESPYSYQLDEHGKPGDEVKTSYFLDGDVLSFNIKGSFRKDRLLIIDPSVVFATFSGSTADNFGYTATFDELGNAYSGGTVYTFGFPTTFGAFQTVWAGGQTVDSQIGDIPRDIGILKYSPDGTKLVYATYIGGLHNEDPHSMVVNNDDELLIFGNTGSDDFPVNISAYDTSYNGNYDAFVVKLSSDGKHLLAGTYIGGTGRDALNGRQLLGSGGFTNSNELGFNYGDMYRGEIIVDDNDIVYVATTTQSNDFPVSTTGAQNLHGGRHDGVVFKLNSDLSSLQAATYYGGLEQDALYGVNINENGEVYVCGGTRSRGLNVPGKAFQDTFQGLRADGIILKFSNDLDTLLAGTYFGTARYDQTYFVQLDDESNVYVTGQTTDSFFLVRNVNYSQLYGKQFIAKLSPELDSLVYCGTFGSGRFYPDLSPSAFLIDQCARIYFTGWGGGANFNGLAHGLPIPNANEAEKSYSDSSDFYLAVFAENMDKILYGSYFGGDTSDEHVDGGTSRYSKAGVVYQSVCAGCSAGASDFPVTPGVVSEKNEAQTGNLCNNALFKLDFESPVLYADFDIDDYICIDEVVAPGNRSINARSFQWDFGDGFTSTDTFPRHQYKDTGWFEISLVVSNILSCPGKDTLKLPVYIYKQADADFDYIADDCGWAYDFKFRGERAQTFNWNFGDNLNYSTLQNPSHGYNFRGTYSVKLITDSGTTCEARVTKPVTIKDPEANFRYLVDSCEPYVLFFDSSGNALSWEWTLEPGVVKGDENPNHLFSDTGSYQVTLRINVGRPCFDIVTKTIDIQLRDRNADFDLIIDSCEFSASFVNRSKFTDGLKWIIESDTVKGDTIDYDFKKPGSFSGALVVDPFSICPDTATRFFSFDPVSVAIFTAEEDTCIAQVKTTNSSVGANKYKWETDNRIFKVKEPTISFQDTGVYEVMLITNPFSECADTLTEIVDIKNSKLAYFEIDTLLCQLAIVIDNRSKEAFEFEWDFGDGSGSTLENPDTIKYEQHGTYEVKLIIEPGDSACSDTFSQSITFEAPQGDGTLIEDIDCFGKTTFFSTLEGSKNHEWYINGVLVSEDDSFSYLIDSSGTFELRHTYLTSENCPKTDLIIDSVYIPEADFSFEIDSCTGIIVTENLSAFNDDDLWRIDSEDFSSEGSPRIQLPEMDQPSLIELIINPGTPCADTASLIAEYGFDIESLTVPNVVTANEDGKNDIAKVLGDLIDCGDAEIIVFNRWGQELFRASGTNLDWEPVNKNGQGLAPGVYYYLLKTAAGQRNGSFTVVR